MSFDLKQLFENVGEVLPVNYEMDLSEYELFGGKPFVHPVAVHGKFENKAGVVFLNFDVSFVLTALCDRCLDEFERQFEYSFEHILVTELNTDSDEYIVVEQFTLDLDELVLSDILLYLPSKLLCSEDCKGLCERCGQNLNHGTCDCCHAAEKIVDPRLAVLDELLK
jgi:uncharacterized protein